MKPLTTTLLGVAGPLSSRCAIDDAAASGSKDEVWNARFMPRAMQVFVAAMSMRMNVINSRD